MKFKDILKSFALYYIVGGLVFGIISLVCLAVFSGLANGVMVPLVLAVPVLLQVICYGLFRKKLSRSVLVVNGAVFVLSAIALTVLMIAAGGNTQSPLMLYLIAFQAPMFPFWMLSLLMSSEIVVIGVPLLSLTGFLIPLCILRYKPTKRQAILFCTGTAILAGLCVVSYVNRPQAKYGGHGFNYMGGYSSTDLRDYRVFAEPSRLAVLDEPAELKIESDYPVLDGAEACYPLYAAVAKAVYADIAQLERPEADSWCNGRYVRFTNSVVGMKMFGGGDVDVFFGARPSQNQLEEAEFQGVAPVVTTIGREAFVFFVEADSPISDISAQALRDIYSGKITNWSQLGGPDREIAAFQRPAGSGSQTMMEYFMGDAPLKEPQTYEVFGGMGDVISQVAQYNAEKGSLGYSFRYFVEELNQEPGVKLLSIDGVAPTLENIKNGTYPLTVPLVVVTDENTKNPNVAKLVDFLLSPQGQELVEKTGYAGVE